MLAFLVPYTVRDFGICTLASCEGRRLTPEPAYIIHLNSQMQTIIHPGVLNRFRFILDLLEFNICFIIVSDRCFNIPIEKYIGNGKKPVLAILVFDIFNFGDRCKSHKLIIPLPSRYIRNPIAKSLALLHDCFIAFPALFFG